MATILVVDDHPINREFLTSLFGIAGHQVVEAADGAQALHATRAQAPDLIFADILMPVMDGIELARCLRADPSLAAIPVIFYTATYRVCEARELAAPYGIAAILAKPSEPQVILDAVSAVLPPDAPPRPDTGVNLSGALRSASAAVIDVPALGKLQRRLRAAFEDNLNPPAATAPTPPAPAPALSRSGMARGQTLGLRLAALLELALALASEHDVQALLTLFCRATQDIMNAKCAALAMGESGPLTYAVAHGMNDGQAAAIADTLGALCASAAGLPNGKRLLRAHEVSDMLGPRDTTQPGLPAGDAIFVPVGVGAQVCGWLYVADRLGGGPFNDEDEQFAVTLAAQLAPVYESMVLHDQVRQHAGQLEFERSERAITLEQLRNSEAQFRQLTEHIHEVLFLTDRENTHTFYVSPAYEDIWGRSREQLYADSKSWLEAVHPDDLAVVHQSIEDRNASGRFDATYRIVRPDGGIRWIHARGFPILDAGGVVVRVAGTAHDISEQRRMEAALHEREAGLRQAQSVARLAHIITAPDGRLESWSDTLPGIIGVGPDGVPPTMREWLDIVYESDRERARGLWIEAGRRGERLEIDYRLWTGNGALIDVHQVLEPLAGYATPEGRTRWFNTLQDVTEHNAQLARIARLSRVNAVLSAINSAIVRLHDREELFREACRVAVTEGAFGMAWVGVIDPATQEGRVSAWFGGEASYAERIRLTTLPGTPYSNRPACVAARELRTVVCNDVAADPMLAPLREDLLVRGHRAVAAFPLVVEHQPVAVFTLFADEVNAFDEQELRLLNDLAGDLTFALQFIGKEERLSYLAYYDALTGLPNARLFQDRLTQFLLAEQAGNGVAVILLNLNRFSQLNDALGRRAGDNALKQVAQRLQASIKEPASVARIGGDVFAVAISGLQREVDAAAVLTQQIFTALEQPFVLDGQEVRISVRAGLSLSSGNGPDAETMFKHAEAALRNAKAGSKPYLYYAPEMNAALAARLKLETELRQALAAGQFDMYYQPRVDLFSGRIVGAEALLRWRHPQRGMVPPAEFIPLAEETGLIVPIGEWIIDAVCARQAAWAALQLDLVPIAINLSAVQFKHGKVLQTIKQAIQTHGLERGMIEFELTESVVMDQPDEAARSLQALKSLGMLLSLDDFGTGYSSLAYLKRFPFDFVKIDRAFITDVTRDPGDAAIATAVVAMAHSLNLRVVAEGVETEGQLQFLRKLRCDEMQGFLFSPAVPADVFEAMLREGKHLPSDRDSVEERGTLLLVDDEPNNLSSLNRLLRRDGYRILTAGNGKDGLDLLATNAVQVIISDQRMPGMSGAEFLNIVKKLYPETIRIILSGYTDLEVVTDCVNRGAVFKFLTKPWDDHLLRENIRDAFRRYRPGLNVGREEAIFNASD